MQSIAADIFQAVIINYDTICNGLNKPIMMQGLFLALCHKGFITGTANYEHLHCQQGELFIIIPNTVFVLHSVSEDFVAKVLYVPLRHIPDIAVSAQDIDLERILKFNILTLDSQLQEDLQYLHTVILHQLEKPMTVYRRKLMLAMINSYIFIILGNVRGGSSEQSLSSKEKITRNFFILLLNEYRSHRDVDYYAKQLFISSKYLSKVIKETSKFSAQEWINRTVLIEAKRLLVNTNLDIMQIAEKLGYSSPSTFARFFKNSTGTTPVEFRKQHSS